MHAYDAGIYSLQDLRRKFHDAEVHRVSWESSRDGSAFKERDYESYCNAQVALHSVIKCIMQDEFQLRARPASVDELDLSLEEKKITIVHRTLHSACRINYMSGSVGYYHNLRAQLIQRIEQIQDADLVVDLDGGDPLSVAKIRPRKEYLLKKYGTCKGSSCLSCNELNTCRIRLNGIGIRTGSR